MENIAFLAYSGGNFWGHGKTERAAIESAQLGHIATTRAPLCADAIELTQLDGDAASTYYLLTSSGRDIDDVDAASLSRIA